MLFFGLSIKIAYSQDPTFSQYYNNPLYYNPGFTGIRPGTNFYLNDRIQWPKIPSQFNTKSVAIDFANSCSEYHGYGIGMLLMDDNEGEGNLRSLSVGGTFAYKVINLEKFCLQAGAQASFVQKKIDWEKLEFSDQINKFNNYIIPTTNVPPNSEKKLYPDFNLGFVSMSNLKIKTKHSKKEVIFILGASWSHLTEPNQSFFNTESKLPQKYDIQTNLSIPINGKKSDEDSKYFISHFHWQKQAQFRDFEIGFNSRIITNSLGSAPFYAGISYRNQKWFLITGNSDALIIDFGVDIPSSFKETFYQVGLSFDKTISLLSGSTWGAIEISLKILTSQLDIFGCGSTKGYGKDHVICPHF